MGRSTDDLSMHRGTTARGSIGRNVVATPTVPNRDNIVVLDINVNFAALANDVVDLILETRQADGSGSWQRIHQTRYEQGTATLALLGTHVLSVLGSGYPQLMGLVPAGYQYRWTASGITTGVTASPVNIYETALEVDAHKTVQWRIDGNDPLSVPPTDAFRLQCDWPCWSPSLAIEQYKRDPSEEYRAFDTTSEPPKAYVRGQANIPGGGTGDPLADDSGNGHTLIAPNGMVPPMASPFDGFNGGRHVGLSKWLEAPLNLNGLSAFTLDITVSGTRLAVDAYIASVFQSQTPSEQQFHWRIWGGEKLVVTIWDAGGVMHELVGTTNVVNEQDMKLRLCWDGTTATLFLNGSIEDTASISSIRQVSRNLEFGRAFGRSNSASLGLDEIRLSNVVRDGGTAYTPASLPFMTDTNTVALWHLSGQADGDELRSATGIVGDIFETIGSPQEVDMPFGKGRQITNGVRYRAPSLPEMSIDESYTIACWMRVVDPGSTGTGTVVGSIAGGAENRQFALLWFPTAGLQFTKFTGVGATNVSVVIPNGHFADGEAHWVAARSSQSQIDIWLDGVQIDIDTSTSLQAAGPANFTEIGGDVGDAVIDMADVAILSGSSASYAAVPQGPLNIQAATGHELWPLATAEPVSGGNPIIYDALRVRGQKADEGVGDSFVLNWRGTDYTSANKELVFPSPTSWEFHVDAGAEVGDPGELMTISQTGQPDDSAAFCIARTAPHANLAFSDMVVGIDESAPMLRGEYARLLPTFAGTGAEIEIASLNYGNSGHWLAAPAAVSVSGVPTDYFRSSSSAPISGSSVITLSVVDKAGNESSKSIVAYFGMLPDAPSVALSDLTGAQRPAHLNETEYAETAYADDAVGATVNIAPAVLACRNSGRDDTRAQIVSGGLSIFTATDNDVADVANTSLSSTVRAQSSVAAAGIKGRVLDQHYRTTTSAELGDYAYNAARADDFGQDQAAGSSAFPYSGKVVEPFTDEYAAPNLTQGTVMGGAVSWQSSGAELIYDFAIADNIGRLFKPRLIGADGQELLHSTWGDHFNVMVHDGTAWAGPSSADDFGPNAEFDVAALDGAASVTVRLQVLDYPAPSLGAFTLNYRK